MQQSKSRARSPHVSFEAPEHFLRTAPAGLIDRNDFPPAGLQTVNHNFRSELSGIESPQRMTNRSPMLIIMSVCMIASRLPCTARKVTGL